MCIPCISCTMLLLKGLRHTSTMTNLNVCSFVTNLVSFSQTLKFYPNDNSSAEQTRPSSSAFICSTSSRHPILSGLAILQTAALFLWQPVEKEKTLKHDHLPTHPLAEPQTVDLKDAAAVAMKFLICANFVEMRRFGHSFSAS